MTALMALGYNKSMNSLITFIGAGVMARSLIAGITHNELTNVDVRVSDPNSAALDLLKKNWGVTTYTSNAAAVNGTEVIVLAVKPQIMQEVCESLSDTLQNDFQMELPLIVSVAAGISIEKLNKWLGKDRLFLPIVRCMPNTPALIQAGMTGLYANKQTSKMQRDLAENILNAVGQTLWLSDEDKLDAVTAISGSGPAYYFLVMEAMQNAAIELGLSAEEARLLVLQTAYGASRLAIESNDSAAILRQRVTSKGGTTEAALKKLIEGGLPELFTEALTAARDRSIELKNL